MSEAVRCVDNGGIGQTIPEYEAWMVVCDEKANSSHVVRLRAWKHFIVSGFQAAEVPVPRSDSHGEAGRQRNMDHNSKPSPGICWMLSADERRLTSCNRTSRVVGFC